MSTPESTRAAAEFLKKDRQFKAVFDYTSEMATYAEVDETIGWWVLEVENVTPSLKIMVQQIYGTHAKVEALAKSLGWKGEVSE
jgi:predicted regulator of amino acid metabolism with ACT domain